MERDNCTAVSFHNDTPVNALPFRKKEPRITLGGMSCSASATLMTWSTDTGNMQNATVHSASPAPSELVTSRCSSPEPRIPPTVDSFRSDPSFRFGKQPSVRKAVVSFRKARWGKGKWDRGCRFFVFAPECGAS